MALIFLLNSAIAPNFATVVDSEKGILSSVTEEGNARFSKEGMVLIEKCIDQASCKLEDMSSYAFVTGPGSFTGIRTGLAYVKGLAFGNSTIKAISLSSLEIMAAAAKNVIGYSRIVSVIDAKLNAVYVATFDVNGIRLTEDVAVEPEALSSIIDEKCVVVGKDAETFRNYFTCSTIVEPNHEDIVRGAVKLAMRDYKISDMQKSVSELSPSYLRASYAELSLNKSKNG